MSRLKQMVCIAAAFIAAVAPLRANIIWSGERNVNLSWSEVSSPSWPPPSIPISLALDLNKDGIEDFTFGETDPLHSPWFYAVGKGNNRHTSDWIGTAGSMINESQSSWTGGESLLVSWMLLLDEGQAGVGPWLGQTGYMGLEFEADDGTHYGWVHMTAYDEYPGMTVHSWAYETTPGEGIVAGAIPEPSSVALLLIGGMGIWAARRKCTRINC